MNTGDILNRMSDNTQITVRRAVPDDATAVATIQRLTWQATYPNPALGITAEAIRTRTEGENGELIEPKIARWRDTIEKGERPFFVAAVEGRVVGYVAPRVDENGQQRLGSLYVLPEFQGRGVGRSLITEAIASMDRTKDICLHVVPYNEKAVRFYEANGFVMTGRDVSGGVGVLACGIQIPEVEMVLPAQTGAPA